MLRKQTHPNKKYDTIFWIGKAEGPVFEDLKAKNYKIKVFNYLDGYIHCLSVAYANEAHPFALLVNEGPDPAEALKFIRAIHVCTPLRDVPCILLNEKAAVYPFRTVKQSGADDYYTGEFCTDDLLQRIGFLSETKEVKIPITQNALPAITASLPKRLFDLFASSMALLVLSPVMLLIAILIKLDSPGPVFYISKRVGTGYRIFNFFKFRSMRQDADKIMEQYMHLNQYQGKTDKSAFVKIKDDPRVTRLGKFLRDTSLDELPQLFNVFLGHMSIVGNRPLPLYEAELVTRDQWSKRFMAPAGITGLWQVTKRGQKEMSEEERIALDMTYADNKSLWYDFKIVARTFPALLQKESV